MYQEVVNNVLNQAKQFIEGIDWKKLDLNNPLIFQLLFLNHAFFVANMIFSVFRAKKKQPPLIAGILLVIATGFGGGIISDVLLGRPLFFFSSDMFFFYFAAAWILVTYSPFNIIHHLTGNVLVELVTYSVQGVFIASFCIGAVDNAVKMFPDAHVAPIILGTLSTTGGGFLFTLFSNLYFGDINSFTSEIVIPGPFLMFSFSASLFYYVAAYIQKLSTVPIKTKDYAFEITVQDVVRLIYVMLTLYLWLSKYVLAAPKKTPKSESQQNNAAPSANPQPTPTSSGSKKGKKK